MKVLKCLGIFVVLSFFVILCSGDREDKTTKQTMKKDMPETVKDIQTKAKKVYKNEKGYWEAEFIDSLIVVHIPEGEFTMGSNDGLPNEKPVHKVDLDGYWLGKVPVTVGQFTKFVSETGYATDAENGQGSWQFWKGEWVVRLDGNWKNPYFEQEKNHPVVSVSWNDAMAYCQWLSDKIGLNFKLPTAAQWEKGARGTDERMYPWGNEIPNGSLANYADIHYWRKYGDARQPDQKIDDGYTETSPVGNYPEGASPYGLLDMAGNVWEWCYDVYDENYYSVSPHKNPLGPSDSGKPDQERVNRGGGSWTDRSGHITPRGGHNLRSAARTGDEQNSSDDHMGFRICLWSINFDGCGGGSKSFDPDDFFKGRFRSGKIPIMGKEKAPAEMVSFLERYMVKK